MQVVRNVGYVKQQQRRGRQLTIAGMTGLAIAFVLVFMQGGQGSVAPLLLAYATMIPGFILFNLGLQTAGKFTSNRRRMRADQALDRALERLNDRYTLVHYPEIGGRHPEHLLVHNHGVLVLTVREVSGKVAVKGRRWRRLGNPLGRFLSYSAPQLGNPTVENEGEVAVVKAYLAENDLPDRVGGVIVFTDPVVEVHVTDSPVDVVDLDGLPDYVRGLGQGQDGDAPPLTGRERLAIVEALSRGRELEQATLRGDRRRRAA